MLPTIQEKEKHGGEKEEKKKERKHWQGMREDSSIFQSLHAASIVN